MKRFEISEYMKPMISKAGIIASRRNKYYLRSIAKLIGQDIGPEPIMNYRLNKLPEISKKRKKSKPKGTSSFKSVGRIDNDTSESPPPNRYSPHYDYLYKQNPRVIFGREKIRIPYEIKYKTPDPYNLHTENSEISHSVDLKRTKGIPFEKQVYRKTIYTGENPHEKRFEREQHSSFTQISKIHSFSSYTARKPLYNSFEYQPEYSPKYSFISKKLKKNQLVG